MTNNQFDDTFSLISQNNPMDRSTFKTGSNQLFQKEGSNPTTLESNSLHDKNFITSKMMDSLKNKSSLMGKMVYGHIYNHNDHTHIHGHVHTSNAKNCQINLSDNDLEDVNQKANAFINNTNNKTDFTNYLQDFQPQLVTVCCDKKHESNKSNNIQEINHYPVNTFDIETSENHQHHHHQEAQTEHSHDTNHHLHQCSTAELDLMNSCFDFDFCDDILCNDFVCDDYIHESEHKLEKNSNDNILTCSEPEKSCPLFGNNNNQIQTSMFSQKMIDNTSNMIKDKQEQPSIHDRFILNPRNNEMTCISCNDNFPTISNSNSESFYGDYNKIKEILNYNPNTSFLRSNLKRSIDSDENVNKKAKFNNKCHWYDCSTEINSDNFQSHFLEKHFRNNNDITTDVSKLLNTNNFDCKWDNCDYQNIGISKLFDHIKKQHFMNSIDSCLINNNKRTITDKVPIIKEEFSNNDNSFDLEPLISCEWCHGNDSCGKKFSNTTELTNHLINGHIGHGKSTYVCYWRNCDRQERVFNQRQKIIRHLHVHTKHKPFKCSICHHCFSVKSMLDQHLRIHSGEKPFQCKICDKQFTTSSSLSVHVRTHTGVKPLSCRKCGKKFSESSNLAKHLRTHEKQFKCEYPGCLKSFDKLQQLNNHIMKHEKEDSLPV